MDMGYLLSFLAGMCIAIVICDIIFHKFFKRKRNKVHFYVARDKDYSLNLYLGKPKRACYYFLSCTNGSHLAEVTHFQRFGLNYKDFKDLKWEDEPIEVFINMED